MLRVPRYSIWFLVTEMDSVCKNLFKKGKKVGREERREGGGREGRKKICIEYILPMMLFVSMSFIPRIHSFPEVLLLLISASSYTPMTAWFGDLSL